VAIVDCFDILNDEQIKEFLKLGFSVKGLAKVISLPLPPLAGRRGKNQLELFRQQRLIRLVKSLNLRRVQGKIIIAKLQDRLISVLHAGKRYICRNLRENTAAFAIYITGTACFFFRKEPGG